MDSCFHNGVYIQGCQKIDPCSDIVMSGFPPSLCQELHNRGFQTPTVAQKYGWPCVCSGVDVTLVSPSGTGKTLAYLLPLLTKIESSRKTGPKIMIIAATSFQSKSVHLQAMKIMEWISAELRFRVCCVHCGNEKEACQIIVSGVDVVIGTPPSLLRIFERKILDLRELRHLVLDDGNELYVRFTFEINKLSRAIAMHDQKLQKIVATSKFGAYQIAANSVTVVTCALEAAIMFNTKLEVVQCDDDNKLSILQQMLDSGDSILVCTSSLVEALELKKLLQVHSWSVYHVTEGFESNDASISAKIIVLSDDSISSIKWSVPIRHIIHYSLPASKTTFRLRLSLFYPAYYRKFSCYCAVLITPQCRQQSVMFTKFLNRLGKRSPPFLLKLHDEELQCRERCIRHFDLCYHLKAWGNCRLDKCTSLHKIAAGLPHNNILQLLRMPKDGTVKLKVHHVANGTRLWASLLAHLPLQRGDEPVTHPCPSTYTKISLDLTEHFSSIKDRQLHGNPVEGDVCAFRDSTGAYYRAQVLKFSQPLGLYFYHREQARIRCIDIGVVRVVDVNQLLTLPPSLMNIPAQVFEVYLCGVKPRDGDTDWPEEAVSHMNSFLEGTIVHGRVALSCGQALWVDPVECKEELKNICVTTATFSPLQELKKVELAEPNPNHLIDLSGTLSIPVNQDTCTGGHELNFCTLPLNEKRIVCITAVDSLDLFYVQLEDNYSSIAEVEMKLNQAEISPLIVPNVAVGDVCAAKFPIDNRWYRGIVLSMSDTEDTREVFFVDYGDTEWVPKACIQPIHPSLLQLPFQAIECSLGCSLDKAKYSGDAVWNVTRDKVFSIKVSKVAPSVAITKIMHYTVELQECSTAKSIQNLLNQNGSLQDESVYLSEELAVLGTQIDDLLFGLRKIVGITATNSCVVVVDSDIITLCSLLNVTEEVVCMTVLQVLHGLSASQERVQLILIKQCSKSLISLLEESNSAIVEKTVHLVMTLLPNLKMCLKEMWINALIRCLKKWKKITTIRCCLLEVCAILIEYSLSCAQWKDVEFIAVLCTFMTSSKVVIKILLTLAGCKTVAAEICQRVAMSEFVDQLQTVQSLEHLLLVSSLLDKLCSANCGFQQNLVQHFCIACIKDRITLFNVN